MVLGPMVLGPMVLAGTMLAAPARAQDAASADQIVVTGTRIADPHVAVSAPITTITAAEAQWAGTSRVEDILNSLPQVYPGQTSTLSNGATGIATADLRGLGPARTLVLIDGRRMVPGDASSAAVDLNFIPAALIKRVDVLTGGASATYGADAVAGVVNFVLDKDFTGFRVDATNSFYAHDNGNATIRPLLDSAQAQGLAGYAYPSGITADGRMIDTTVSFGSRLGDGGAGEGGGMSPPISAIARLIRCFSRSAIAVLAPSRMRPAIPARSTRPSRWSVAARPIRPMAMPFGIPDMALRRARSGQAR